VTFDPTPPRKRAPGAGPSGGRDPGDRNRGGNTGNRNGGNSTGRNGGNRSSGAGNPDTRRGVQGDGKRRVAAPRTMEAPPERELEAPPMPRTDPRPVGEVRRPPVQPGRSARRHWRLVATVTAVCVFVGLLAGLARSPKHTADARLVVGRSIDLGNLASIPGLSAAGQQLASDYSRLVSTGTVQHDVAKRLGAKTLDGSVTASPVPQSPVVLVEATASSDEQARRIAGATASALVQAVNDLNTRQTAAGQQLLDQYRQADEQLLRDTETLNRLQAQASASGGTNTAVQDAILAAQTAVDADKVRVDTLATDYGQSFSPSRVDTQAIQRVGPAQSVGTDRTRTLELYLLVALVIGLVLGIAAATWRDYRARR
jgi:capsular polysaccharide biosynthesis protein